MPTDRRLWGLLAAVFTLAISLPQLAASQDRDTQEVLSYKLTESGLEKYAQATRKLAALPGACAEEDAGEDSEARSLDAMVAKLNAMPDAAAAIQSVGMSTREFVVFSWSIVQNGMASWAMSQPGGTLPPGVSKANVDFVKQHDAELKEIEALDDEHGC
jgi:hypothetical protein